MDVPMRIALVAPLAEAVPPKFYGGTERVVWWLAEELVRQGHRVVLFASAESDTGAELIACAPQSLRLAGIRDHLGSTLAMLREARRRAAQFDIIGHARARARQDERVRVARARQGLRPAGLLHDPVPAPRVARLLADPAVELATPLGDRRNRVAADEHDDAHGGLHGAS